MFTTEKEYDDFRELGEPLLTHKKQKRKIGDYELTEDEFCGETKIEGDLDLRSLTHSHVGFNPTVGGDLDLESLTSIPRGSDPTVEGVLDLSALTSIPEGFNPTVGGSLFLDSLTSIPEGFGENVKGTIYTKNNSWILW